MQAPGSGAPPPKPAMRAAGAARSGSRVGAAAKRGAGPPRISSQVQRRLERLVRGARRLGRPALPQVEAWAGGASGGGGDDSDGDERWEAMQQLVVERMVGDSLAGGAPPVAG